MFEGVEMNAYEKAQALGLTGTDAEIVAELQALKRHHRNAYITGGPANTESVNLLHLLTARHRVMGMGSAQQWVGPLIDLESGNAQVALIMSILRPTLQVNDALVYCADSDDAADMLNALTAAVAALTGNAEQVIAEVALLTGGRIGADYAELTPEEFAAQRTVATDTAATTLRNGYNAEAHDAVIHAIRENPQITRDELLVVWSNRLAEVWA